MVYFLEFINMIILDVDASWIHNDARGAYTSKNSFML